MRSYLFVCSAAGLVAAQIGINNQSSQGPSLMGGNASVTPFYRNTSQIPVQEPTGSGVITPFMLPTQTPKLPAPPPPDPSIATYNGAGKKPERISSLPLIAGAWAACFIF